MVSWWFSDEQESSTTFPFCFTSHSPTYTFFPPSLKPPVPSPAASYRDARYQLTPRTRILYAFGEVSPSVPLSLPPSFRSLPPSLPPSLLFLVPNLPHACLPAPPVGLSLPLSLPQSPAKDLELVNRAINRPFPSPSSSPSPSSAKRGGGGGGEGGAGGRRSQKKLKM